MMNKLQSRLARARQAEGGFTLIELMIVLLVLSLLATIVLLSVNGFNSDADDARKNANCKEKQTADAAWYAAHPGNNTIDRTSSSYTKYFDNGHVPTGNELPAGC